MNMDIITLEDCIIQYEVNQQMVLINDGYIIGFEENNIVYNMAYFPSMNN